ncbi:MAG: aminotransferase class V-fold PLP-dependent enzyme [Dehalococcoidia bacterium]
MDIGQLREQIPACSRTIYMNTGWSGPSPVSVVQAVKERLEYESYEGPTSQPVLDSGGELRLKVREAVAQLLNVSAPEVCLTQNTTEGLNIVLNGFPWQGGDEIVTFDIDHSSVLVPCLYLQRRCGVRIRAVSLGPSDDWETILSKVEDALTARTRMLVFSHVQYSSGLRMPVEELRSLTRSRETYMLLDGAQTPGHISLDLESLGADFYSIPAHKWLLGPDGAGALYIRKDLIRRIEPTYVAYQAVESTEEPIRYEANSESMDKFDLTTTSVPLTAGFLEAVRFIREVGVEQIEARNRELAASLKARLSEVPGITILSPEDGPGVTGLTTFRIEGVDPAGEVERLWLEHRIVTRCVESLHGIRISLDFFNTEEEIGSLVDALPGLKG